MNVNVFPCVQVCSNNHVILRNSLGGFRVNITFNFYFARPKMSLQNTIANIKMGNPKSKTQLNEENQRMEGSRVVKDPPPPYTEVASDLAVATPDHSTLSFAFDASNQLTAIEDRAPAKVKVGIDDMQ